MNFPNITLGLAQPYCKVYCFGGMSWGRATEEVKYVCVNRSTVTDGIEDAVPLPHTRPGTLSINHAPGHGLMQEDQSKLSLSQVRESPSRACRVRPYVHTSAASTTYTPCTNKSNQIWTWMIGAVMLWCCDLACWVRRLRMKTWRDGVVRGWSNDEGYDL